MAEFSIYVQPIVDEAIKRNIHVSSSLVDISKFYAVLKYKGHTEYLRAAITDRIGHITFLLFFNKVTTHRILRDSGYPVPESIFSSDLPSLKQFLSKHNQVVVKPLGFQGGQGITAGIKTDKGLEEAFVTAQEHTKDKDRRVICQEHLPGDDNRILVIDKKHIFAVKRIPAHVIGDGRHSIKQLIDHWNEKVPNKTRIIKKNQRLKDFLGRKGLTLDDIPKQGDNVQLDNLANAHRGGISIDTTDDICEEVREISLKLVNEFNLPVVGIDFMSEDITTTPGKIIELNPHPGITLHHNPTHGKPRNVAGAIVDLLFPETKTR